jgi:hypothetical protein
MVETAIMRLITDPSVAQMYMRNCTVIDKSWLPELVPSLYSAVS